MVANIWLIIPELAGEPARHIALNCADIPLSKDQVPRANVNQLSENTGWKYSEPIRARTIDEPFSVCRS